MPVCGDTVWGESCRDRRNHAVCGFLVTVHVGVCDSDELDAGRAVVTRIRGHMSEEVFRLFEELVRCDAA